jgi:hypothetical protein
MTRKQKLIDSILNNVYAVRFQDACKIAEQLRFTHSAGKGSHRVYKRVGEPIQLNFQNRNGYIPPYQARQLLTMIEKYNDE